MPRVVVLNAKGGCGKTTIATSLAAVAARANAPVRLLDLDPLGSARAWAERRPEGLPPVRAVGADRVPLGVTRSFLLGAGPAEEIAVFDTPAGLGRPTLDLLVRDAAAVIVPVLPSAIDIRTASRTIAAILLAGAPPPAVAVVANRVRARTRAYAALGRFLATLDVPLVTVLRDCQSYVTAAETGRGIHEIAVPAAREETRRWLPLLDWLETRGVRLDHGSPPAPPPAPDDPSYSEDPSPETPRP